MREYELPPEWLQEAEASVSLRCLTRDGLRTFATRYRAPLDECGFAERSRERALRPADARPVKLMAFAIPLARTASGS